MAKRTTVRTHKTDEIQGEGSFVMTTSVKVKEIRAARAAADAEDSDGFEDGLRMLSDHIVDWDWVDDDGKDLPTPKDDPDVIGELTNEEAEFLAHLLIGSKN